MGKFKILTVLGAVIYKSIYVKYSMGSGSVPNLTFIGATYMCAAKNLFLDH